LIESRPSASRRGAHFFCSAAELNMVVYSVLEKCLVFTKKSIS
jgi:hypothetical protein